MRSSSCFRPSEQITELDGGQVLDPESRPAVNEFYGLPGWLYDRPAA